MSLKLPEWMQAQNRVKESLREVIVPFWKQRLETDPLFTFQMLSDHVAKHGYWRPNSPSRILELLRKEGSINYVAEKPNYKNRRASIYKALPLTRSR
jgi:hypothetical protein